jgi:hypothetical protein
VEATSFPALDKPESRFGIEFSAVEFPTAFQARDRPFDPANPRKFLSATRTSVEETAFPLFHRKGKRVAARFIPDFEIATGATPFRTVWRNPPAASAELGKQMRELMAQSAVDFRAIVLAEPWIQRDEVTMRICAARGAEKPSVPFHTDLPAKFFGAQRRENFARRRFESGITPEHDERGLRRKNEVELLSSHLVVRLQGAAV